MWYRLKYILLLLFSFCFSMAKSQNIKQLFKEKQYQAIIDTLPKTANLSGEENFMLGFSHFKQEADSLAIVFFDKAIKLGYQTADTYYNKALALIYLDSLQVALPVIEKAITKKPKNQTFIKEKAFVFYHLNQLDSALALFKKIRKTPDSSQVSFYMIPHIYSLQGNYDKSIEEYYKAIKNIKFDNNYQIEGYPIYIKTLIEIGNLEFAHRKNYAKAAKIYEEIVDLMPIEYQFSAKLIKSYAKNEEYEKIDSVFETMKKAYQNKKLPAKYYKTESIIIEELTYKNNYLVIQRSFKEAKAINDIIYYCFVLNKGKTKINKTLAIKLLDKEKFVLSEEKANSVSEIYDIEWNKKNATYKNFRKSIMDMLDGKITIYKQNKN